MTKLNTATETDSVTTVINTITIMNTFARALARLYLTINTRGEVWTEETWLVWKGNVCLVETIKINAEQAQELLESGEIAFVHGNKSACQEILGSIWWNDDRQIDLTFEDVDDARYKALESGKKAIGELNEKIESERKARALADLRASLDSKREGLLALGLTEEQVSVMLANLK